MSNDTAQLLRSVFAIPKMDCASEERMVRMALEGAEGIRGLEFDLAARRLSVLHEAEPEVISARLEPLGLGAKWVESSPAEATSATTGEDDSAEGRTLWILLGINAAMFVIEMTAGWMAQSMGLIADSLDMFADAAVYSVGLYAVGRAARVKVQAAYLSGWLQLLLAMGAFVEVVRRFVYGSEPEPSYMIGVAIVALAANVACLLLVSRHRHGGAHMKASWIFSTNDVLANIGVIVAGALVAWTSSQYPDLVIGTIIAVVVTTGAIRILRLR